MPSFSDRITARVTVVAGSVAGRLMQARQQQIQSSINDVNGRVIDVQPDGTATVAMPSGNQLEALPGFKPVRNGDAAAVIGTRLF